MGIDQPSCLKHHVPTCFDTHVMAADLTDDKYRSLAALVRKADPPGFYKTTVAFAEVGSGEKAFHAAPIWLY